MSDLATVLRRQLGDDRVMTDDASLEAHRADYWVLVHLRMRQGRATDRPSCVVLPRTTDDIAKTLRVAQERGVPVVPYGAGSGVLGGAVPPAGAIVIDLRAMDRILELNETALWVRVQAGMMGDEYERQLDARGYTMGHFPQSIARSTVGGWVATRAAGQFSTKYGNIEDMLLGLEIVLPSGEVARVKAVPRASTGPSLRDVFCGSEGALGIVTELTYRIHPVAEHRASETFAFPSVGAGLEAIRRVMRAGWRPAVVRLYDAMESVRNFSQWMTGDRCALLVVCEGPRALVEAEMAACRAEAAAQGATTVGTAPVDHWMGHRNTVPSWDQFFDRELIVDTIEVAADWDRVSALYEANVAALQTIPGMAVASAHSSHSYQQGTNLYITFVVKPPDFAQAEATYLAAWTAVMETTLAHGGTIAHHHGVGRLRTPWLERELGTAYSILKTLKRAFDPAGIMNPGVLIP